MSGAGSRGSEGKSESSADSVDDASLVSLDSVRGESLELSNIKHSVRTPLNQIIGYTEMLEEELSDVDKSDLLPDLRKIHTAGGQLLALFNDGLASWKFETGKVDLDSIRLEMRTPLNLIIGYSELCQEMAEDENETQWIPDLMKISGAAHSLLNLVESTTFPTILKNSRESVKEGGASDATLGSGNTALLARLEVSGAGVVSSKVAGVILLVDDNAMNRDMLFRRVERQGHEILEAECGEEAMKILKSRKVDLVLLDVLMPGISGYEVLQRIKADDKLKKTAVIMLSALDEIDIVVNCIQSGADDYVPKPFNPVLLNARIAASLEKKRLQDESEAYTENMRIEREKSEALLLNTLPKAIADRLREEGTDTIADQIENATVLFADIVGFTPIAGSLNPKKLVEFLNDIFSGFDWLADLHGVEKIKTIGDSYMAAGGIPDPNPDHASSVADLGLEMIKMIKTLGRSSGFEFSIRVGICSGPVVAGVIGRKKFFYDLWGDTVNVASRMESHGAVGRVHVSESTYQLLRDRYVFEPRGPIEIKGKGEVSTYFLVAKRTAGFDTTLGPRRVN